MESKFKKIAEKEGPQAPQTTPLPREEIYLKLKAPFPDSAYGADMTREDKVLTSLKAHYVVERLNDVFGVGMWKLTGEWKDVDDGILFIGELTAQFTEKETLVTIATGPVPGFGGTDHANSGDAYKSARTDCLSKAASLLGVGNEMYKGNIEPKLSEKQKQSLEKRSEKSASRKQEEPEETDDGSDEAEEKPKARSLRPARSFNRGSKLRPRERENEENGDSDSAADNAS